jgi:biopolymer transport protein ExbB
MTRWLVFGFLVLVAFEADGAELSTISNLDELLEQVRQHSKLDSAYNKEREKKFLEQKQQQKKLLDDAKRELAALDKQSRQLNDRFEKNEELISNLEKKLEIKSASLGELFGAVRQLADDASGIFTSSIVSVQLPGRAKYAEKLSQSKALPTIDELEKFWVLMLEEMTQSGKVVKFSAPVITTNGKQQEKTVTRVGVFNSFASGQYLSYVPESERLIELARQPASHFRDLAYQLENTHSAGYHPVGLDVSRGAMLSALLRAPDLWERIQQGGIIGYVILGVGLLATLMILERITFLTRTSRAVQHQLKSDKPDVGNPLGRVLQHFEENPEQDTETLQLKLDEAVLKELPKIERGLASIGVLAAIAPLLGLLGTVTGMIATFQSITLYGTSDPKYMSSGISEALVTTELGLIVAVPIVLVLSFLTNKGNNIVHVLDEQSAGVVAKLVEQKNLALAADPD